MALRRGSLKKAGTVITTLRNSPSFERGVPPQLVEDEGLDDLGRKMFAVDRLSVDRAAHVPFHELGHIFGGGNGRLHGLFADDHGIDRRRRRRWA